MSTKNFFQSLLLLLPVWGFSQAIPMTNANLSDMNFFKSTGKTNWQIVGDATADLSQKEVLLTQAGTGVLVNLPNKENKANLQSVMEHGDADFEFDVLMANHSNSGFYLQGRYEVQLLDSWGVKNAGTGDMGGIYKRRKLPEYKMYEGHAPRQNACLAPGLWQHFQISFQAPRFDASGKKTANARMLKIILNGVIVQENVEMTGPTGGPISEQEAATGPLMIQGDHGAVAFRNIKFKNYDKVAATLGNHQYKLYTGEFKTLAKIPTDFSNIKLEKQGQASDLTWEVSSNPNNFCIIFNSTLKAPTAGKYIFTLAHSGAGRLRIDGKEVITEAWGMSGSPRTGEVELSQGDHTAEIVVSKVDGWLKPGLGLSVEGPGFRNTPLNSLSSMMAAPPTDPILVKADAREATILRSFVDELKDGKRVKRLTHAVNVGTPENLHYTYDMDNGSIAQVWKGGFLEATPMWDNRGDGSSRPIGAKLWLGSSPVLSPNANNIVDSLLTEAAFKPMGYDLDDNGMPTFRYKAYSVTVEDFIKSEEGGKFFSRELKIRNDQSKEMYCVLAKGNIKKIADDLFLIGDKAYYIKIQELEQGNQLVVSGEYLLAKANTGKVKYAIWW